MPTIVPPDFPERIVTGAANLLPWGGVISSKGYKTVRDAFQDPPLKSMMLDYWRSQVVTMRDGYYKGTKSAGNILSSAILEHPKILLEHDDFANVKIFEYFKEVQALKLPFPKMVVVVGLPYDVQRIMPDQAKMKAEYGDGHLRQFFSVFASQLGDEIKLIIPMLDGGIREVYLVEATLAYAETPTGRPKVLVQTPHDQLSWISQNELNLTVRFLAETIYMMTLNPNTTEVCISIPDSRDAEKNKKRIRKNKKPSIEFKLITVDGKKPDNIKAPPLGTHASPRQHWRRGHWRHYASGKTVFIDPMLVGDEKNGKIVKDYAVGLYDNAKDKRVQQGIQ